MRNDQGSLMPDTTSSSQLQWTHHRAQLNPAAQMVAPLAYLRTGRKYLTGMEGGKKK